MQEQNEQQEQEAKLQREILEDAQRKAERIVARARRDGEKLVADARQQIDRLREERLVETRRTAEDRVRAILASIDHDKRKAWLELQERLLVEVFETAMAELRSPDRPGEGLPSLLAEAMGALGPDTAARVTFQTGTPQARCQQIVMQAYAGLPDRPDPAGASLTFGTDGTDGGILVEAADGRRRYDNTYQARLERLRDDLRCEVASILHGHQTADPGSGSEDHG